jgi:hypothetical protein
MTILYMHDMPPLYPRTCYAGASWPTLRSLQREGVGERHLPF